MGYLLPDLVLSLANPQDGLKMVNKHGNKTRAIRARHRVIKEPKITSHLLRLKKKRKQGDKERTRYAPRTFNVLRKTEKWKGRKQNLGV